MRKALWGGCIGLRLTSMCKISSCFCRTEYNLEKSVRYAATCAHPPLPTLLHPLCKQDKSRHFRKFLDKGRILVFGELLWLRIKFSEDPLRGKACEPSFYLLWVPLLWIRRSTSRCVRIIILKVKSGIGLNLSDLSPLKLEKNISQIPTASCYHRSPLIWLRIDDPCHLNRQPRQLLFSWEWAIHTDWECGLASFVKMCDKPEENVNFQGMPAAPPSYDDSMAAGGAGGFAPPPPPGQVRALD